MPKENRWHQTVKQVLKEIGEDRGYNVEESEKEMIFSKRFTIYIGDKKEIHSVSYKPDVVWKKGHQYKAIFEIEYLNPKGTSQLMNKRKYAIGSLMLGYVAMLDKSVDNLYFVTNSEPLCSEMGKLMEFADVKNFKNVIYLYAEDRARSSLKKELIKVIG